MFELSTLSNEKFFVFLLQKETWPCAYSIIPGKMRSGLLVTIVREEGVK